MPIIIAKISRYSLRREIFDWVWRVEISIKMQLEPLVKSLLFKGLVSGAIRMKSGLMSDIRSVGLALAVISTLIQPSHAGTQPKELSTIDSPKSHSTNSAQLLAQSSDNAVAKVTGVKVNSTDQGIEVILESANPEALKPVNNNQGNSFIADITNAVLALPNGGNFTQNNPAPGIVSVSVTQANTNTLRVTVIGEGGLPNAELFDGEEGLIFALTPVVSAAKPQQSTPTESPSPEQPSASEDPIELTVTGERDGYRVQESSTATKIDAALRDIPASVQVIPKEVIQDRQVVRLNELADNVSGVRRQETFGGLASQGYFIRGFSTGFETLRDGFRDFGFTSPRDVANIERVEFLKGPASVLYGSATSPGGVVNTITKKPLTDPFYQISGTIGNYDFYRTAIDLTGPLLEDRSALYRLNAAYENANSFRDFVENESIFINPVISIKAGENTNITFAYEYQKYDYTFDRGFPANPAVFNLPLSRFLGEPDLNDAEFTSNNFTYALESKFGNNNAWKFRQAFNILNVTGIARGVQPDAIEEDGRTVRRRYRVSDDEQENISFQNEISGSFNTGSIRHNVLVGVELARYQFTDDFFRGDIASLDIFNPVYGAQPENIRRTGFTTYGGDNVALYFQNLIEITPTLKFLAGGRFDWVDSFDRDLETRTTNNETSDSEFSPRLGIVYQPTNTTSLYASWTNSFNPQIFGRSRNNEAFIPETGEQFEVGIKQELFDNRLSATLAYFDITRNNVLTTDPLDTDFSVQTGEQKSRGLELDIAGEILPGWKVIATYTYTDAYVSEDNDPETVNDRLAGVPYNSASLWTTYEFQTGNLQGLGLGMGIVYVGEREATLPNDLEIPSYVRTDATIFYRQNNWRAAVNFKNLFDTKYYESQGFFVVPAAPFTVLGTVSFDF